MSLSLLLLLLLLLVGGALARHFYGTVMTYYPKNTNADGSVVVVARYKLNFHSCSHVDAWSCTGNCGTQTSLVLNQVHVESSGEWCQREGIMTRQLPSNAPFQLSLAGGNWISNIQSITSWRAVTLVELRNRSDTGRANRSPQTTVLPALRVPSNCRRDFNLLAFDPDGDEVKCRNGNPSSECNTCTPASVLSLSSPCTLSFSNTSTLGAYVVQLVMEDFPRQTINLTATDGTQVSKTTNNAISKLPVQFALRVDAAVQDCTEGLYLPKFLPPTPANGARLYTPVNQPLEIRINAQANTSTISELLFSGPHNTNRTTDAGLFILRWTPSGDEDGESHPFCYVVQAVLGSVKYHSELRCLIVSVGIDPTTTTPTTTTVPPTTTTTTPTTTTTTPTTTTTTIQPTTVPPTTTTMTPTTTTTAPTTTTMPPTTTTMPPTTTTTAPTTTTMPPTTTTTTPTTTTMPPTTTTMPPTTTTTTPTTTTMPPTTTTTTPTTTTMPPTTTTMPPTTTTTTTTTPTTTTMPPSTTTMPPTTTTMPPTTTTTAPTTTTMPPSTTTMPPTTTTMPPTTTTTAPTTTTMPPSTTTMPPTTTTMPPTTTTTAPTTTTTTPTTTTTTPTTTTMPPTTTPDPNQFVIGLRVRISSSSSLSEEDIRTNIIQQLKNEMIRRGLPSDATVRLVSSVQLGSNTTATPVGVR